MTEYELIQTTPAPGQLKLPNGQTSREGGWVGPKKPVSRSAGVRLRYELKRELAPCVGFNYQGRVFESADRTRAAGEDPSRFFVMAGLRLAFL